MQGFVQEIGALERLPPRVLHSLRHLRGRCHFYIATDDPQYTPIWKVEPFKQAYKREASPFAPLFKLFGLKREVDGGSVGALAASAVRQLQHVRPLQSDLSDGHRCVRAHRAGAPRHVRCRTCAEGAVPGRRAHQRETGQPEASAEPYRDHCSPIGTRFGVEIPLDKPEAEIHVVRTPDRHRALPGRRRGTGASRAAPRRVVHLSQRRFGGRELRLLCGRQGLANGRSACA